MVIVFRFEDLKIDCNDQLHIFDGAHAIGNPKVRMTCKFCNLYRMYKLVVCNEKSMTWPHFYLPSYTELKPSDWLRQVMWLDWTNRDALFRIGVDTRLIYDSRWINCLCSILAIGTNENVLNSSFCCISSLIFLSNTK